MDDLRDEYEKNKGMYLGCSVLALLSLFGGVMAVLGPKIGEGNAALLGLGLMIFVVLTVIGSVRGIRIARIIAGIILTPIGLAIMGFIGYDFIRSLLTGESVMGRGLTGSNFGMQTYLLLMVGFGIFGGGVMLLAAGFRKND